MSLKFHFCRPPGKPDLEEFIAPFAAKLGDVPLRKADIIVAVPGDGSLLYAFHHASKKQKVIGIVPTESNSVGFWANHGIADPDRLLESLAAAQEFEIHPLRADITMKNGKTKSIWGYNEIVPNENGGQSLLTNLTIHAPDATIGPVRIMGGGVIVATAYGSSAMNIKYGSGAINDIRNEGIAITGKGISTPHKGFRSMIAPEGTRFEFDLISQTKRPARVIYDGMEATPKKNNPFEHISVYKDPEKSARILLTKPVSAYTFAEFA